MQYGLAHWFGYKFLTRYACLTMVPDGPADKNEKDEFTDLNATQVIREAITEDDEHIPDVGEIMGGGGKDEEDFSAELAQLAAMVDNMPAPPESPPPAFEDDLAGLEVIQAPDHSLPKPAATEPAPPPSSLAEIPDAVVEDIGKISLMQRILGLFRGFRRHKSEADNGLDTLPSMDSIASLDEEEAYHPPWYLRKGIIIGLGLLALLLLAGLSFLIVGLFLGGNEHKTPSATPPEAAAHAPTASQHATESAKTTAAHAATSASTTAAAASGTGSLQQQYEALVKKNQQLEAENKQLKQGAQATATPNPPANGNSGVIGGGDQKGMDCQLVGGGAQNSLKKCIEQFNQQDAGRK